MKEDIFRFFRSDPMPFPILDCIRVVPIEADTDGKWVFRAHLMYIPQIYIEAHAKPKCGTPQRIVLDLRASVHG